MKTCAGIELNRVNLKLVILFCHNAYGAQGIYKHAVLTSQHYATLISGDAQEILQNSCVGVCTFFPSGMHRVPFMLRGRAAQQI